MVKYTKSFEKGYFWEGYIDLERQLLQYLEYVPYLKNNEKVYSFRLMNILFSIGGYIDSSLKEISRYPRYEQEFKNKKSEIKKYNRSLSKHESKRTIGFGTNLEVVNNIYRLSDKKITFKRLPEREDIFPFKEIEQLKWWSVYNGTKHDLGKNLEKATLKTVLQAMGAAFLINAVHRPSLIRLYKYDVLTSSFKGKKIHQLVTELCPTQTEFEKKIDKGGDIECLLETELFIYNIVIT